MKKSTWVALIATVVCVYGVLVPALFVEPGVFQQWIAPFVFCTVGSVALILGVKNELLTPALSRKK